MRIIITDIRDKTKNTFECLAEIPLTFLEGVSSNALKYLAKNCQVTTIEELTNTNKKELAAHIKNPKILNEILDFREILVQNKKVSKKKVELFKNYLSADLKSTPTVEKKLIGLFLFTKFLKPQYRGEKRKKFKLLEIIAPESFAKDEDSERIIKKGGRDNFKNKAKKKRIQNNAIRIIVKDFAA